MRALANDREITATLGVPVRRVEAAAWFGSGLVCGAAGLLLPDLLTSLDYSALTFLVIASLAARADRPAAARSGRRCSAASRSASPSAVLAPIAASDYAFMRISPYRAAAPFVLAIVALLYISRRRVVTISRTPRRPLQRRSAPAGTGRPPSALGARPRPPDARRAIAVVVVLLVLLLVAAARVPRRRLDHDVHERRDLLGRRARVRHPLRPGRDDLARPGRAALGRLLDRHAPRLRDARSRSRSCCSPPARSPARSACSSDCRPCGSPASTWR